MPGFPRLSLVEGSFEELALELATYLDQQKGEGSDVLSTITPKIADAEQEGRPAETDKDAVLESLVGASDVLNSAPEKELQAAYNLLIHLISQSEDPDNYIRSICLNLRKPITSSPANNTGIALSILGTIFNTLDPDGSTRYNVLTLIIELVKKTGNFETLEPQLETLDKWIADWELEPKDQRRLFTAVSDTAAAASNPEASYRYLLKALLTLQSEPSSSEARDLSLRALKAALQHDKHFDFQDLTSLDSIQALRKSDEVWYDLLELYSSDTYSDLQDFKESNDDFFTSNNLSEEILDRKMRLLTLASSAAHASQTRTLPYAQIAKALQIPSEDVEMWVIDCIRSGLVEGKLSQQKQEFLIHRSTYRSFGENQWREVASRLENWKSSLVNVLAVIRQQKEEFEREKGHDAHGSGGGFRRGMGGMQRGGGGIEVD
nr:hypothetical protein B0A51_09675 [Rachicladosporium sp. CCFEE 5018]